MELMTIIQIGVCIIGFVLVLFLVWNNLKDK